MQLLAGRKIFYARPFKTIWWCSVALLAQIYGMQLRKIYWRDDGRKFEPCETLLRLAKENELRDEIGSVECNNDNYPTSIQTKKREPAPGMGLAHVISSKPGKDTSASIGGGGIAETNIITSQGI